MLLAVSFILIFFFSLICCFFFVCFFTLDPLSDINFAFIQALRPETSRTLKEVQHLGERRLSSSQEPISRERKDLHVN